MFGSIEKPAIFFKKKNKKVLTMAKSRRYILLKKTGPQFQNLFVAYEISEK